MYHSPDHFWPDLLIQLCHIILIKVPTFGNISSKNEVINARVYLNMQYDISENFVTECLIKVQIFFNHFVEKTQLDQDGYNLKKYMWNAC